MNRQQFCEKGFSEVLGLFGEAITHGNAEESMVEQFRWFSIAADLTHPMMSLKPEEVRDELITELQSACIQGHPGRIYEAMLAFTDVLRVIQDRKMYTHDLGK